MNLVAFSSLSDKEADDFTRICNYLLSNTFVMREDSKKLISRDYRFVERNLELFSDYLSLSGWRIYKDSQYGIIYVRNVQGYNKLTLNKLATVMLITMRIIYEERRVQASNTNDVCITVAELFGKIVNDFSIYPKKPPQKEIKDCFRVFEQHNILYKLDDSYDNLECRFVVLPSILIAVSNEKCKSICDTLNADKESEQIEKDNEAAAN